MSSASRSTSEAGRPPASRVGRSLVMGSSRGSDGGNPDLPSCPLPPCGEGLGWGVTLHCRVKLTPHPRASPRPPPQGGEVMKTVLGGVNRSPRVRVRLRQRLVLQGQLPG